MTSDLQPKKRKTLFSRARWDILWDRIFAARSDQFRQL